jgi:iron complex outermembrane receptor protein
LKYPVYLLICATSLPAAAWAQADANAVKSAGDAFGYRRGDESVGIYDERSVRGFSLEAAGNFRLNGTYFVKNAGISNVFIESSSVRIGYNTLGLILPGPSGVVDYRLRDPAPGEMNLATFSLEAYGQPIAELNLRHGSESGNYSYSVGASRNFDVRNYQGGSGGEDLLLAGIARLSAGPFTGRVFGGEYQYRRRGEFRIVPGPSNLPPRIPRGRYLGQDWAFDEGQRRVAGLLMDASLGRGVGVGSTVTFGQEDPTRAYLQFFDDIQDDGSARGRLVIVPQQRSTAISAEARGYFERDLGSIANRFDLSLRRRRTTASFGGAQSANLGRVQFGEAPDEIEPIDPEQWAADKDTTVNQSAVGLSYRAELLDKVRVNLGIIKTWYSKELRSSNHAGISNDSEPWLYNAGLAFSVRPRLELYGSYAKGLEETGIAPSTATNRNELLSAIIVTQREIGLRWTPKGGPGVVIAGFDTRKPYAGLDSTNLYRFLGAVRHRGFEGSVSGKIVPGVHAVVGGVWVDAEVAISGVNSATSSLRPVGVPRLRAIASIDAQLPWRGLSLDAMITRVGRRAARSERGADGTQLHVEGLTTLNLGGRYSFRVAAHDLVLRVQVLNVTNNYEWDVNTSETLAYSEPRRARVLLTARF